MTALRIALRKSRNVAALKIPASFLFDKRTAVLAVPETVVFNWREGNLFNLWTATTSCYRALLAPVSVLFAT